MNNIKIKNTLGQHLDFKEFVFPGGEIGVKLNNNLKFFEPVLGQQLNKFIITARLKNSEEVIKLAMVKDALEKIAPEGSRIDLEMFYTPYARQDRICDIGEAFSLKVFCNLINSLNFNKVTIADPHSDVTPALLNNVEVVDQLNIFHYWDALRNRVQQGVTFISPDAGSNKKVAKLAKYFEHKDFIRADKLRDLSNGDILETIVYSEDLQGRDVMIADDIGDGMRTFIELAKVLKAKNAGKIVLYITHGIFSKGTDIIFNAGIDEVWTTNSVNESYKDKRINVFKL